MAEKVWIVQSIGLWVFSPSRSRPGVSKDEVPIRTPDLVRV